MSEQPGTPHSADRVGELRETLRELHEQLEGVSDPDEGTLDLVRQVRRDLDRVAREEAAEEDGILDRIEDAAVDFSSEHPVLAENLRRIVNLLNGMGI